MGLRGAVSELEPIADGILTRFQLLYAASALSFPYIAFGSLGCRAWPLVRGSHLPDLFTVNNDLADFHIVHVKRCSERSVVFASCPSSGRSQRCARYLKTEVRAPSMHAPC